jgi:hypothetical protein
MYKIAYITETEANQLRGLEWVPDNFFNPIQDVNDQWFISSEEVLGNTNQSVAWVNNLPLSDYPQL